MKKKKRSDIGREGLCVMGRKIYSIVIKMVIKDTIKKVGGWVGNLVLI